MDEADVLGDRIAIMSEGTLRTAGSSFFLKKKFGTGYKLICARDSSCDPETILQTLKKYSPDARIDSTTSTEAIFLISEEHLHLFEHIFKELEDNSEKLGISTFGCNLSTLEEVFLKLGTESHEHDADYHSSEAVDGNASSTVVYSDLMNGGKVSGFKLMAYQVWAMMLKKVHYHRRNYRSVLYLACVSGWLTFVMMSAPNIDFFSATPREISLSSYKDTTTILESVDNDIFNKYKGLLGGKNKVLTESQDMEDFFLNKAKDSLSKSNLEFLVGATIKENVVTAWFNGQPLHTMPLTINMINRAILKAFAGSQYDISLVNKPFVPWTSSDSHRGPPNVDITGVIMPIILIFLLATMWPSIFIGFYVKERESRAKLLQLISGANRFVFWLSSFLFDFIFFCAVFCAIVGGIAAFQRPFMSTFEQAGTIYLVLAFYSFATLPFIYAFSYLFSKHATAESMMSFIGILCKFSF
jgi:ATP-binding cassette, subfamily A (ABC1), member 3